MINIKLIEKLLTNNRKSIPLLFINFNHKKYKQYGKLGSCDIKLHPAIKKDEKLTQMINELVDYIRDNNDMSEM